jgi:hypothetical protein
MLPRVVQDEFFQIGKSHSEILENLSEVVGNIRDQFSPKTLFDNESFQLA